MKNEEQGGLLIVSGNKRSKEKLIKVSGRGFKQTKERTF